MRKKIKIAPSILSADFARMGEEIKRMESCGADLIHCDVMDGVFVPNITFGIKMIRDIRSYTKLPLDVHLMIVEPEKYLEKFVEAGADIVTFHVEATKKIKENLKLIKSLNCKCGIVVSPDTDVAVTYPYLEMCDMALVMSVYPGFGGQKFMPSALDKLRAIKEYTEKIGKHIDIEVDGGVTEENVGVIKAAGANVIVAGNTVFASNDSTKAIKNLREN